MKGKVDKLAFRRSLENIAKRTHSTRILRYFPNCDLRCGHEGLRDIAKKQGVDPWELSPGEFLVFANAVQNRLKIYAPGNVIAYLVNPDYRKIDLDIVRLIPRFFNGTEFNYKAALAKMVDEKLERKRAKAA